MFVVWKVGIVDKTLDIKIVSSKSGVFVIDKVTAVGKTIDK